MAAADIVTLTDEQLSDMRHVVEQFNEMRCDRMVFSWWRIKNIQFCPVARNLQAD